MENKFRRANNPEGLHSVDPRSLGKCAIRWHFICQPHLVSFRNERAAHRDRGRGCWIFHPTPATVAQYQFAIYPRDKTVTHRTCHPNTTEAGWWTNQPTNQLASTGAGIAKERGRSSDRRERGGQGPRSDAACRDKCRCLCKRTWWFRSRVLVQRTQKKSACGRS